MLRVLLFLVVLAESRVVTQGETVMYRSTRDMKIALGSLELRGSALLDYSVNVYRPEWDDDFLSYRLSAVYRIHPRWLLYYSTQPDDRGFSTRVRLYYFF